MKTKVKSEKNGTISIKGLSAEQWMLLSRCLDLIRDNIEYDEYLQAFTVDSGSIVASFNEEEVDAIREIIL